MTTDRIYEYDSMRKENTAQILSCKENSKGYDIVCDSTVFYPEGGGQPHDTGFIGEARVLSVSTSGDEVVHRTDRPLPEGSEQPQNIDWDRRFDLMQHHTAEHLVSGAALRLYGANNIGFHLSPASCFVDFDRELSAEEVDTIEQEVNRIAQDNRPVVCRYPAAEDLEVMSYRSKSDRLHGPVRIVMIEGGDSCACCGAHLPSTGYIGMIKLLDRRRNKGGVRLTLVAGSRALAEFSLREKQLDEISALLSSKLPDCADFVRRMLAENGALKLEAEALNSRLTEAVLDSSDLSVPVFVHFAEKLTTEQIRAFALAYLRRSENICAVIAPAGKGARYALASSGSSIQNLSDSLHKMFGGKGGGRGQLIEGYLPAPPQDVLEYFAS